MAVVWNKEIAKDRSVEVNRDNDASATRAFLVRVDDPTTPLSQIRAAPGINLGDVHPDEADLSCESIDVSAEDDSGLLYAVTFKYAPVEPEEEDDGDGEGGSGSGDEDEPNNLGWSGSSSVSSEPTFTDVNGDTMTNSAGDPLEDLEAERAQFHLSLTMEYPRHDGPNGWVTHARKYTNTVNSDVWNGGVEGQWKCQGSSAKLNSARRGEGGALVYFWEVTWDFAFRADFWALRPWDIGFNELVDEDGEPYESPGISTGDEGGSGSGGGGCEGVAGRRSILGQDGKPVRQPVALQNGKAKPACERPNALYFEVYTKEEFSPVFGEVFTPGVAPLP